MSKRNRGRRDSTGPYRDSYARRSGQGGKKERCYEKPKRSLR